MPIVTIDGKTIEVEAGTTIIRAAERLGIYVPRYCYHPALSVVATCRMCLVEVEKAPKLMTACSTPVVDGMVVFTDTEKVKKARQDVLEFLLINHPLDCPICDQAGECSLQDYYMDYALYHSRFPQSDKIQRRKKRILGEYLVLDNERCILCTRCVRFLKEVTKTEELAVFERSDRSEIDLLEGRLVNNPYSICLADICPVGAITSRDFRFRMRVWHLSTTESICTGCATGCNISVQHRNGTIYRLLPRVNKEVNGGWMCDRGRSSYKMTLSEGRIVLAGIRKNGGILKTERKEVINSVIRLLKQSIEEKGSDSIGVMGSANLSLEDNIAIAEFARGVIGTKNLCMDFPFEQGIRDGILINRDPTPNSNGARLIHQAYDGIPLEKFISLLKSGAFSTLIIPGNDIALMRDKIGEISTAGSRTKVIGILSDAGDIPLRIDFLLPRPSYFECRGLFMNFAGRVQKTEPAVASGPEVKPLWFTLQEVSVKLGHNMKLRTEEDVLKWLSASVDKLKDISYGRVNKMGCLIGV